MKIWKHTDSFTFKNPVVTIGIFDGVHLGHRHVLKQLIRAAEQFSGESVVITLWPHPRLVLNKDPENLKYLTSLAEKTILLNESDVDHLIVIDFTNEFAQLDSCEFIKDFLVDRVGIKNLVIGYNQKFGKDREGDFQILKSCAKIFNFSVEQSKPLTEKGQMISSTIIREKLLSGDLDGANHGLGYEYFLQGKVIGGNRKGREIGFPTANIIPPDEHKLIPMDGVYAVGIKIDDSLHQGMMNIGYRPTVNLSEPVKTIEVNIFNFEDDVYGKDITIYFSKRLRDEIKFNSIEQLTEQLVKDKKNALKCLGMRGMRGHESTNVPGLPGNRNNKLKQK